MGAYINVWNTKPRQQIYSVLEQLGLKNTFSNYRTSIWENEKVHISVDKRITRILLYNEIDNSDYTYKMIKNL